ncbi:MAG: restriction endonuclease subunit S [Polyangiaceae bacterium]|nr:restriction endonuclease subunit S [Polyangiaceae bacterium]
MPNLNTSIMSAVPFVLPPLPEQRAIARILGTLDDKIELNRKMNETLEAMARALFKSWFVDFDPVRAKVEGRAPNGMDVETANLFPNEFVESELGDIPKGWLVRNISDILSLEYGKALKEADRQPGDALVFGSNGVVGRHSKALVHGRGIVVGRKGNPGIVKWAPSDFFVIDTAFFVQAKEPLGLRFLFHHLDGLNLARLSADSAVPGVNRNAIYAQQIVVPQPKPIESFENIVESWGRAAEGRERESATLARLRDSLLPRLLSGELDVSAASREVEGAA